MQNKKGRDATRKIQEESVFMSQVGYPKRKSKNYY
jgi:hypothetical protein